MSNDSEIESVTLRKAALLARGGNHAGALRTLLDAAAWLFAGHSPKPKVIGAIGTRRQEKESDPLNLAIAELDIDPRLAAILDRRLGAIYVRDLQKWTYEEIRALPRIGDGEMKKLRRALRKARASKALRKPKP